jgi:hypothetical protein
MVTTPDLSCWGGGSGAGFPINQEEQLGIGQLIRAEVHRRPITVYSTPQPNQWNSVEGPRLTATLLAMRTQLYVAPMWPLISP